MHLTVCVSMIPSVGLERRPAARRRSTATSHIRRSNRPSSSQRRNQPYTVRHGGRCDGKARHGPPTRRCQPIARTTASVGVAASHCEADQPVPANGPPSSRQTAIPYPSGVARAAPGAPSSTSSLTALSGGPRLQLPRIRWGLRSTIALKQALREWIGYYNARRPHSALAGRTPDEAYWATGTEKLAA